MRSELPDYQPALDYLSTQDADFAQLIAFVGPCMLDIHLEREPYEALVRAVAYQQLHPKAGDAIVARLLGLFAGFPTPHQLANALFDDLRACGFSGRKIETLKGIAEGALSGVVPSRVEASLMTDDALIARLVTLKGIGQWTVEMLLIFTLGRMDVLPADDFGVVHGYKRLKRLSDAHKRKEMMAIAQAWSPYRTIASWYLWRVPK